MKSGASICFGILIFLSVFSRADNAPVTRAGIILNAPVSPSITVVPVTVTDFIDIGSFSLTLDYSTSVLTYVSAATNPAFTGMTVTVSTPGRIVINYPAGGTGITLPDQSVLLNISFNYISSGTQDSLKWYNNGATCQFTRYAGGSYVVLNDLPSSTYYIYGAVTNHPAPITIAPVITSAVAGSVTVPIKVAGFSKIGSIYLNLEYDPDVLTYTGFTPIPQVGSMAVGNNNSTGGKKKITMSWFGTAFALADSSVLVSLNFTYANVVGKKNYTELIWLDDGPSCEYSDGQYRVLYDGLTSYFLRNGLVASQRAPQTWLPEITDALSSGLLAVPVRVSGFNNIRSFTLTFEYDPAVMTYSSFSANAAFGGTLTVTDAISGSKRKSVISWSGSSPLSLSDGSSIATLNFTYSSGTSELTWLTGDATSCRYNDNIGNAYYDLPKASFYHSGLASSHVAPRIAAWYASPSNGQQFTLPLITFNFSGIATFMLTLDYDPGVLAYQGATLVPSIGGTFSATSPGPGRIIMEWTGSAATLADSSVLVNLTFTKSAGSTALAWYDNGNSCKYALTTGGSSLYDLPRSKYYVNGYVGSDPLVADFTANNTTPEITTVVTFTDLSTGGATSWFWDIRPSGFAFMNGTSATSKNPQVMFPVNGAYTIILIVYRGSAAGMKFKSGYIHSGTPGLWTGITSINWQTASNWHNYQVPVTVTNVLIPASAPNWPHVSGNLTIGTQCHQLTMEGSSQLTVDGNFTINAGSVFSVASTGTLILYGNWTNDGVFNTGTGTVEFTGTEDATIIGGASTDTFYHVVVSKVSSKLYIQGYIIVNGPCSRSRQSAVGGRQSAVRNQFFFYLIFPNIN